MVKQLQNVVCLVSMLSMLFAVTLVHAEDERDAAFPKLSTSMSQDMPDDPVYWMLLFDEF